MFKTSFSWILTLFIFFFHLSCKEPKNKEIKMKPDQSQEDVYTEERERMVRTQIEARDVKDTLVLSVMRKVPRHLFVPDAWRG